MSTQVEAPVTRERGAPGAAEASVDRRATKDADYDAFVRSAGPSLKRYAFLLCGTAAEAEDLYQDSLVKVYLAWNRLEDTGSLHAYTRTVMARAHIARGRRRRREVLSDTMPEHAATIGSDSQPDERDAMWRLLVRLSRQQRTALVLRYYEGLGDPEIADVIGCGTSTVRAYISRGLERLRAEYLAEQQGEAR